MTQLSLVCIPFAGSGAGFYRPWRKQDTGTVTVVPVQLPGREERFADAPYPDVATAAKDLAPRVLNQAEHPIVLFGHSLGAVVAFELARELERCQANRLSHLVVSGSPGPWAGRERRATGLDDAEFLERVTEFAGYRHEAFDDPDMRDILLPLLRADVAMHEDYRPAGDEPVTAPIIAIRGEEDTLVGETDVLAWRDATAGAFHSRQVPGGHMYLVDGPQGLLEAIMPVIAGETGT